MQLEDQFEVAARPEEVWDLLNDVPRVIPCMPGAELQEVVGPDRWKARMKVKMGPIALQFGADVTRDEADDAERRVRLAVVARELRGRGGARATIRSTLSAAGEGTRVEIVTDVDMQGAVAQYGRGIVGDVAAQLTKQFAASLAAQLEQTRTADAAAGAAADTAAPAAADAAASGAASAVPAAGGSGAGASATAAPPRPAAPAPPAAKPVSGLRLLFKALWSALTGARRRRA